MVLNELTQAGGQTNACEACKGCIRWSSCGRAMKARRTNRKEDLCKSVQEKA